MTITIASGARLALHCCAALLSIGCDPISLGGNQGEGGGGVGGSGGATSSGTGGTSGGSTTSAGGAGGGGEPIDSPVAIHTSCRLENVEQDGDYLYFFQSGFDECDGWGHIARIAKDGGAPELLADVDSWPSRLAMDGTDVYWTSSDGAIRKVAKDGGSVQTVASGLQHPAGLRIFAGFVYFAEAETGIDAADGRIGRVPTGGGNPTVLVGGLAATSWLTVDSSGVYFAAAPPVSPPWANGVPVFEGVHAGIYRVALDGGPSELLSVEATTTDPVLDLEVDDGTVYFLVPNKPGVLSAPTTLMSPPVPNQPAMAFPVASPFVLAQDVANLYTATDDFSLTQRELWQIPKNGGDAQLLAPDLEGHIRTIAIDDEYVYWVVRAENISPSPAVLYKRSKL